MKKIAEQIADRVLVKLAADPNVLDRAYTQIEGPWAAAAVAPEGKRIKALTHTWLKETAGQGAGALMGAGAGAALGALIAARSAVVPPRLGAILGMLGGAGVGLGVGGIVGRDRGLHSGFED